MTNRQLLKGWRKARLREVLDTLESGLRPSGGVGGLHEGVPSIGGEHLNNEGGFDLSELRYVPHDFYAKMQRGRIQVRDIVIVKDGATTGKVSLVPADWPFDKSAVNEHVFILRPTKEALPEYLFFYLYSHEGQHEIKKSFQGSAQGGINQTFAEHVTVPLPPLPVQERIVQILQKADEIRHKRREALELADKILPALFLEMFGDPAANSKRWPMESIGSLVSFDTAQIRPEPGEIYPYLAPEHIESGTGNYTGPHPTDGQRLGSLKHPFTVEHVLYCKLRPYLNKVVLPHTSGLCSTELVPLRPGPKLMREFLAIYLRLPFFVSAAVQKSQGTKMPRFGPELMKREMMIVPPIPLQQSFCLQVGQLMESVQQLKEGSNLACSSFESLLARAFTGELTAEWEAANAEEIAAQQALHERLPRLLLLALLVEKVKRAYRAVAEVLVTALMKYAFLLQMEGNAGRRRVYHFVPYHYGPFAKELYKDLQTLQEEGLVRVENDSEEEKTKITLVDSAKANEALAALPDDLKEDAAAIIETYGSLDHNALLKTVYERYPAYAKKSRLRRARGAGRAQKPRGRRG